MAALYLYFNAALYAVFGLWCALGLDGTSRRLGYSVLPLQQRPRRVPDVYGGLQWAWRWRSCRWR